MHGLFDTLRTLEGKVPPVDDRKRIRLATEEIVVGYAMSRLDGAYYQSRGLASWNQAYAESAEALDRPEMTFKDLRDEFDPYHGNSRKGWRGRLLRLDRQCVTLNDCRVFHAIPSDRRRYVPV